MFYAGIDIGSTTTKVVIIDEHSNIVGKCIRKTGANMKITSEETFQLALKDAGISKAHITKTVATGYGRNVAVNNEITVPEIIPIGKGIAFTFNNNTMKTILDIGGQDTKVVKVGGNGNVLKFVMNDACAAGTGRFLENIARTMDINLEDMIEDGYNSTGIVDISSTCTVFAESEIITYLSRGEKSEHVFAGLHNNILKRVNVLIQNVGLIKPIFFTGGVTKNKCIRKMLEQKYGQVIIPSYPQFISAIGSAVIAKESSVNNKCIKLEASDKIS